MALRGNPAATFDDLPEGAHLSIIEVMSDEDVVESFIVYLSDVNGFVLPSSTSFNIRDEETNLTGFIEGVLVPDCGAYEVTYSYVSRGYGPLLYDVAMEYVTRGGYSLMSDRTSVSKYAFGVWTYYRGRPDVEELELPPRKACEGTDTERSTTGSFRKSPVLLDRLDASGQVMYFDDHPPMTAEWHQLHRGADLRQIENWETARALPMRATRVAAN